MKLLFENWRKYLNEGIDPRIQKQIDMLLALPDVAIRLKRDWGSEAFLISYVRTGEGAPKSLTQKDSTVWNPKNKKLTKTGYPHGYVQLFRDQGDTGPCLDSWIVYNTMAEGGWGPLLYEVAIEWASQNGGGLASDRAIVSGDAQAVWSKYAARSGVGRKQMDISYDVHGTTIDGKDVEEYPQLTPDIPEDDCDQSKAIDDYGVKWHESPVSRMYFKGTPEVITALKEAGRWVEG